VDSRLLEIAPHKIVSTARRAGIQLKQTFAKEGKELRRRAGGYAHAKQFRRLKKVVERQRTTLGIVMREVQRKLKVKAPAFAALNAKALSDLTMWLERAERIRTQQTKDKNKLYTLHAPEVECIGKVQSTQALRVRRQGRHRRLAQGQLDDGRPELPR
jgi:transposase, IS5 family